MVLFTVSLPKYYLFSLPHYALIGLVLIHLLFLNSVLVNLTIGGLLGHKVSIDQPLLSLSLGSLVGVTFYMVTCL